MDNLVDKNIEEKLDDELISDESSEKTENEIAIISEENLAGKIYNICS